AKKGSGENRSANPASSQNQQESRQSTIQLASDARFEAGLAQVIFLLGRRRRRAAFGDRSHYLRERLFAGSDLSGSYFVANVHARDCSQAKSKLLFELSWRNRRHAGQVRDMPYNAGDANRRRIRS